MLFKKKPLYVLIESTEFAVHKNLLIFPVAFRKVRLFMINSTAPRITLLCYVTVPINKPAPYTALKNFIT